MYAAYAAGLLAERSARAGAADVPAAKQDGKSTGVPMASANEGGADGVSRRSSARLRGEKAPEPAEIGETRNAVSAAPMQVPDSMAVAATPETHLSLADDSTDALRAQLAHALMGDDEDMDDEYDEDMDDDGGVSFTCLHLRVCSYDLCTNRAMI